MSVVRKRRFQGLLLVTKEIITREVHNKLIEYFGRLRNGDEMGERVKTGKVVVVRD